MATNETDSNVIKLDDDCVVIDLVSKEMQGNSKCINYACKSGSDMIKAPMFCQSYYRLKKKNKKNCVVCMDCYNSALHFYDNMAQCLVNGDKLVDVDVPFRNDLVEIDDSDEEVVVENEEYLPESDIKLINENVDEILADMIDKFNVKDQITALDTKLSIDVDAFETNLKEQAEEVKDLRKQLDKMLEEIYGQFKIEYRELPPIEITDVPNYMQKEPKKENEQLDSNNDVILIEEPPNLPKTGKFVKSPLKLGETYYVAQTSVVGSPWMKVILQKIIQTDAQLSYEVVPVSAKLKQKQNMKCVTGKELAYSSPAAVKLAIGARVIAVFTYTIEGTSTKRRHIFYAGIVAEYPTKQNFFRYLIFFDDGYANYVQHNMVYPVVDSSVNVWEDFNGESQMFIKKYLNNYPDRPMVKFLMNQKVTVEYNGTWWTTTVTKIDASLVKVIFDVTKREEWIYRGSTRLRPMYNEEQAAANRRQNNKRTPKLNASNTNLVPYVQYTNEETSLSQQQPLKAVARKSTAKPDQNVKNTENAEKDLIKSKIIYYTPKRQKPSTQIYRFHTCSTKCRDLVSCSLKRLLPYSPLSKPLLCGFHRLLYKYKNNKKHIVYKAPCGRILRNLPELHYYLRLTKSMLTVDYFNFETHIRCLAEFYYEDDGHFLNKDLSSGQEKIAITVLNCVDNELIDFCNYSTKREPMEGVNLNLDPNFLCGCDCEDDCADKLKCQCWQLTLEGMKYIQPGINIADVGYSYRRLIEPVHTGIYECNSRCKCAATCLNRVVQNPLQHKLQVFKTKNRGWGIRCINDIPQGAFICIYAGALLTEKMANEGGQCYGDEYLAELDYIEVVEKMKEDYEAEVIDDDPVKSIDHLSESEASIHSADDTDEEDSRKQLYEYDRDFIPSEKRRKLSLFDNSIRAKLRKRSNEKDNNQITIDDDTVTISDDEEDVVREPSSFNPKTNPQLDDAEDGNSIRLLFGKDEHVYIMDAKSTGNIGRFLNHSCSPNVFVQNVFVDTHDLRFPWVAFFAMSYVKAGSELTWNYQYDVGSVPGKILICRCESSECKGRLL